MNIDYKKALADIKHYDTYSTQLSSESRKNIIKVCERALGVFEDKPLSIEEILLQEITYYIPKKQHETKTYSEQWFIKAFIETFTMKKMQECMKYGDFYKFKPIEVRNDKK